jgi:hypothetical protein
MSYIPASSNADLWAVLGGLLTAAVGLGWWVRRGDRKTPEGPDLSPPDAIELPPSDPAEGPGPRHGEAAG